MKNVKIIDQRTTKELVKQIEGKVWSCVVPAQRMTEYERFFFRGTSLGGLILVAVPARNCRKRGLQICLSLVGLLSIVSCVCCTLFLSVKCKDALSALLISITVLLVPFFAYTALGVNWISALLPSVGVGMQNNFLYRLINFNYLHIGNMSFWTPHIILIVTTVRIPIFCSLRFVATANIR